MCHICVYSSATSVILKICQTDGKVATGEGRRKENREI